MPPSFDFTMTQANLYLKGGQWEAALGLLLSAAKAQPNRPDIAAAVGFCFSKLNRPQDSVSFYKRAADLQPNSPEAFVDLGSAYELARYWGPAEEAYNRALSINPKHDNVKLRLANLYLEEARLEVGRQLLVDILATTPGNVPARLRLADFYLGFFNLDLAYREYQEVLKYDPSNGRAQVVLGEPWASEPAQTAYALQQAGRLTEALPYWMKVVNAHPDWAMCHLELAQILEQLHHPEEAKTCWQNALRLDPGLANKLAVLGQWLTEVYEFDKAFIAHNQAISLVSPCGVSLMDRMSDTYFHYGQFERGERVMQRLLDDNQRLAQAHGLDKLERRYLRLYSNQIGHLGHLDWYVKMGLLGQRSPHRPVILAETTPNPCYLNYWRRYIPDIITDAQEAVRVAGWGRLLEDHLFATLDAKGEQRAEFYYATQMAIQKQWEAEGRSHLLELTEADAKRGQACLEKNLHVPAGAWFVSMHVRDSLRDKWRQGTRDADITAYELAIQSIVDRGGWVIRMGDRSMPPMAPKRQVVDYALSEFKSDWMDVFLWARCRFFIGVASGPALVPPTFGVPVVITNWTPFGVPDLFLQGLCTFKLYWSETEKRLLQFEEVLASDLGFGNAPDYIAQKGVRLVDNTPEEINDVVLEMLDRLEGQVSYSAADNELQARFDQLKGKVPGAGRIGRAFLRKYAWLMDAPGTSTAPPARGRG